MLDLVVRLVQHGSMGMWGQPLAKRLHLSSWFALTANVKLSAVNQLDGI